MGYRDEDEALRARVAHLEAELGEAHAELERLRGASPDAFGEPSTLLGGPTELGFEREIDRELDEETLEEIVGILRHELGDVGRLDRLGGTLTWVTSRDPNQGGRRVEVTIERRRGRTRVVVRERLGQLAGGLFGSIVGGVGGGGLGGVIPAAIFGGVAPVLIPVLALGWVGGTWAAVRLGYGALTRRRAREHARIARRLDTVIGARSSARVRVEAQASDEAPVELGAMPAETKRGREA